MAKLEAGEDVSGRSNILRLARVDDICVLPLVNGPRLESETCIPLSATLASVCLFLI